MFREVKGFVSLFFHTDDFGVDQMERIIRLNPKLKPLLSKNLSCFSLLIFPSFWMDSLFFLWCRRMEIMPLSLLSHKAGIRTWNIPPRKPIGRRHNFPPIGILLTSHFSKTVPYFVVELLDYVVVVWLCISDATDSWWGYFLSILVDL